MLRIGAGAGLSKNGDNILSLIEAGFNSIEVGTVTLNPIPASINKTVMKMCSNLMTNRIGLVNDGFIEVYDRIIPYASEFPIGISISGFTVHKSEINYAEIVQMVRAIRYPVSWVTLNFSSPNYTMIEESAVLEILRHIVSIAHVPVRLKVSPLWTNFDMYRMVDTIVVANTIPLGDFGGLSGRTLLNTDLIEKIREVNPHQNIIGSGGIWTQDDVDLYDELGVESVELVTSYMFNPDVVINIRSTPRGGMADASDLNSDGKPWGFDSLRGDRVV